MYWTVDKRMYKRERDWGITISKVVVFILALLLAMAVSAYVMLETAPLPTIQNNNFYRKP